MSSLIYLQVCEMKNRLLELRHRPGKLIFILAAVGFVVFLVVTSLRGELPEDTSETFFIKGIFFAFFMFSFVTGLIPAFGKGLSNYGMEDVNFLFVAPIHPQTILLYGIMKALRALMFGSFFIVFQIQWMRSAFGIGVLSIIPLAIGYVLMTFAGNILAQLIYGFTNGVRRRKSIAKVLIAAVFVPTVVVFFLEMMNAGWSFWDGLPAFLLSPVVDFTPVVGWAVAGIYAFFVGDLFLGLLFFGLLIGVSAIFIAVLYLKNPDFYEDTLGATETAFEVQRAAQEGDMNASMEAMIVDRNIKIKGTGLMGFGAKVFLFKHLRESLRVSRFGLWGFGSLALVVGAPIFAFFTRPDTVEPPLDSYESFISVLSMLIFAKMFTYGVSRGSIETYNHYIYMIPAGAFSKWIWANGEAMLKALPEAIIIFTAMGFILGLPVAAAIAGMFMYILFVFYLCGINLAFMRIYGAKLNSGLIVFLYFVIVIVPLLPGIAAWILIVFNFPTEAGMILGMASFNLWQFLLGLGCFLISKGVLHNCDMPVAPGGATQV